MSQKVVIIGGVAGGAGTAARLRRNDENAQIIMFERGGYISFANCGLPYYIGNTITERDSLLIQTPEAMKQRFNIDIRIFSEVTRIIPEEKCVEVTEVLTGKIYKENYDKLVISTGASPVIPPIEGIDGKDIYTLWTIPDTDNIKAIVDGKDIKKAAVIGGGFVGLEIAENLVDLGIEVSLIEMQDQVMTSMDRDMAQFVHMELNAKGVKLFLNEAATSIKDTEVGKEITLTSGKTVDAEIIILSVGIKPNSKIAKDCGIECGPKGHIIVNEYLETNKEDIYALGDVIEVVDYVTGKKTAVPLAGPANKMGRIMGDNLCGMKVKYNGTQGTYVAKIFDVTASGTGATEKSLKAMGKEPYKDYMVVYGHSNNHAGYYPGFSPLHTKLIFDPKDGKIFGAQAVGQGGTEKRIDVIATSIRFGGTIYDLTELELAYAPPYNTAKDPMNFLGFAAENILKGKVGLVQWHEMASLDLNKYQIIDTRRQDEFDLGTIPGSVLIPVDEIREKIDMVDKERIPVVFCRGAVRSYIAARVLLQNGWDEVLSMAGGYLTWEAGVYKPKN
ncbi:MAG: hypothetical protein E7235_07485 [Lachnospiraceae bacterium]|nr:hypothetical protein [Lachnospiraceae bacterium]